MALGLPEGFFAERFSRPVANVRAVHYLEGQPSNPEAGIFGVGEAHLSIHIMLSFMFTMCHRNAVDARPVTYPYVGGLENLLAAKQRWHMQDPTQIGAP